MDQLKDILGILKKHHFWVICGVLVIIGFGTWYSASAALKNEEKINRGKWEDAKKKADALTGQGVETGVGIKHPNDETFAETNKLIDQLKKNVKEAWEAQYQKQKDILVWPESLPPQFRAAVDPLRPIEKLVTFDPGATPPTPTDQEISIDLCEMYRNFITGHLPTLADRIGAKWGATAAAGNRSFGGAAESSEGSYDSSAFDSSRGGASDSSDPNIIVDWSTANQSAILQKISYYPGQESKGNVPTTLQLLYAQEDLWVISSLLDIIKRTNGDVDGQWQAKIKQVRSILIGADAKPPSSSVMRLAGGTRGNNTGNEGAPSNQGQPGQSRTAQVFDPAEGRYVNNEYQPLSAADLRSTYTTKTPRPEEAYLSVAKRMPIRLNLVMDQRAITKLLVECGNSPLPVEVRQVRIASRRAGNTSGGQSSFGGGGGFGGGESSIDPMGGGGSSGGSSEPGKKYPFDTPVELYGIIYIYNTHDPDKLAVPEEEPAEESGTSEGSVGAPADAGDGTEPADAAVPAADAAGVPAAGGAPVPAGG